MPALNPDLVTDSQLYYVVAALEPCTVAEATAGAEAAGYATAGPGAARTTCCLNVRNRLKRLERLGLVEGDGRLPERFVAVELVRAVG